VLLYNYIMQAEALWWNSLQNRTKQQNQDWG
jgi:hypothetical protein